MNDKKLLTAVLAVAGIIIIFGGLLFMAIAIDSQHTTREVPLGETTSPPTYYYDEGGKVMCYVDRGGTGGGLSFLPVNETAYNVSDFQ